MGWISPFRFQRLQPTIDYVHPLPTRMEYCLNNWILYCAKRSSLRPLNPLSLDKQKVEECSWITNKAMSEGTETWNTSMKHWTRKNARQLRNWSIEEQNKAFFFYFNVASLHLVFKSAIKFFVYLNKQPCTNKNRLSALIEKNCSNPHLFTVIFQCWPIGNSLLIW